MQVKYAGGRDDLKPGTYTVASIGETIVTLVANGRLVQIPMAEFNNVKMFEIVEEVQ